VRGLKVAEAAEKYKTQLEATELGRQKQILTIQSLKSQLATKIAREETKERENKKKVADAAKVATASKTRVISLETDLAQSRKNYSNVRARALTAEREIEKIGRSTDAKLQVLESKLVAMQKRVDTATAKLKQQHLAMLRAGPKGAESLVEVGFRKQWTYTLSDIRSFGTKRRSNTFAQLAMMALKMSSDAFEKSGRTYEYKGRMIFPAGYHRTLAEVSNVIVMTRRF